MERTLNRPIVALITDFGLSGSYVAAMKAVILTICPDAVLLDISHDVGPQSVEDGAFWLSTAVPLLPPGTVCLGVVDPGVGTARAALGLQTPRGLFVGPDNGLLSAAFADAQRMPGGGPGLAARAPIPNGCNAVRLVNTRFHRSASGGVSRTFHGRDIFAPAAAHLANGVPLSEFGPPAEDLMLFPSWQAQRGSDGMLTGRVLVIDSFGNLITDVREEDIVGQRICVELGGREFHGLSESYQDGPEFTVYAGSAGFLELGRRNGSAAATLGVSRGEPLRVIDERQGS